MDVVALGLAKAFTKANAAPRLLAKSRLASAQPIATPSPTTMTFAAAAQNIIPHNVGRDRLLYGAMGGAGSHYNRACYSTDGAATVTGGYDFDAQIPTTESLFWVTRTSAGFLAITNDDTLDVAHFWFSATWAGTFTTVKTTRAISQISISAEAKGRNGQSVLAVGEYGGGSAGGRQLWLTQDGGQTWTSIKTTAADASAGNFANHFHCSAYDESRHRLWTVQGDQQNAWFGYTDDLGASWVPVKMPTTDPLYDGVSQFPQPSFVAALHERTVGSVDRGSFTSGMWDWDPDTGKVNTAFALPSGEVSSGQFVWPAVARRGREMYVQFADTGSNSKKSYIVGTGDWGRTWWLLATIAYSTNGNGKQALAGVDQNGYIFTKTFGASTAFGSACIRAQVPTWTWSTAGG